MVNTDLQSLREFLVRFKAFIGNFQELDGGIRNEIGEWDGKLEERTRAYGEDVPDEWKELLEEYLTARQTYMHEVDKLRSNEDLAGSLKSLWTALDQYFNL